MAYTYTLSLADPDRVAGACTGIAFSFVAWADLYGIHFESIINQHDGTIAITLTNELPAAEARSIGLID